MSSNRPLLNKAEASLPIGIFDSGLGGLSIAREIRRQLPEENLIYLADSAYAPYGNKSVTEIQQRCELLTDFLLKQPCKAIVFACNTATVNYIDLFRQQFSKQHPELVVVGIEPAIKPAARMTQTGVIGLLATEATLKSSRVAHLIETHAGSIDVIGAVGRGFVEAVEIGDLNLQVTNNNWVETRQLFADKNVDVVVLGCTHYPFLTHHLQSNSNDLLTFLDPAQAVVRHLQTQLEQFALLNTQQNYTIAPIPFYSSAITDSMQQLVELLLETPVQLLKI